MQSNITGECLILVAIPMSGSFKSSAKISTRGRITEYFIDDMENQRSMRLAREVDMERRRTIGMYLEIRCRFVF